MSTSNVNRTLRRWLRAPGQFGRLWRALRKIRREFADWPRLVRWYAGLGGMTAGSSLRMRDGAVRQVTVWEGGDVSNVWAIFGADEYLVRDTDEVIVDVGANVGLFALYAAQTAPRARIYCFEPLPQNFYRLQQQVESAGSGRRVGYSNAFRARRR
jgi:hypothetical protein